MKVTDPVCKMTIEDKDAIATSTYKGSTYFFCSKPCKEDFEGNPETFVSGKTTEVPAGDVTASCVRGD